MEQDKETVDYNPFCFPTLSTSSRETVQARNFQEKGREERGVKGGGRERGGEGRMEDILQDNSRGGNSAQGLLYERREKGKIPIADNSDGDSS